MSDDDYLDEKMRGQTRLIELQETLLSVIVQSSSTLDEMQIAHFTQIYSVIEKLLVWWNESIAETNKGFALIHGRRNKMISFMTKIIVRMQMLSHSTDPRVQDILQAIDELLEELSGIILDMESLEDSA